MLAFKERPVDFHNPAIQSVLQPLIIAFALAGTIRFFGGMRWGSRLASVAVTAALLLVIVQLLGVPPWVPRTGMHKLSYVVLVAMLLSVIVAVVLESRGQIFSVGLFWLALSYLWLAWPRLRNPSLDLIAQLGLLYTMAALTLWRLVDLREQSIAPLIMILLAAIGLAGVAFVSGSLSIAQIATALAAAVGGVTLWNWPTVRFPCGAAGVVGGGSVLLALMALTFLLTDASLVALAPLVFVFFANTVSRRLSVSGRLRGVLDPIYLVLVAAVPAVLAIVLAHVFAPTDNAYYQ